MRYINNTLILLLLLLLFDFYTILVSMENAMTFQFYVLAVTEQLMIAFRFCLVASVWSEFSCPANQHPESTIERSPHTFAHLVKCRPCFLFILTFELLLDLRFAPCSRDPDILSAQRIIGFFYPNHPQINEVRKFASLRCHLCVVFTHFFFLNCIKLFLRKRFYYVDDSTREEKQIINLSQACFTLRLSVIECRQESLVQIVSSSDVFQKTRFSWPYLVLLGNNPHPNTHGLWIQSVSKWKHFSLVKSSAQNVRLAFPARTSDGHHTYGTFDLSQSVQCLAYDAEHFTIFFFSLRIFSRLRVPAAVVWKAKRNCLVLHHTARLKCK